MVTATKKVAHHKKGNSPQTALQKHKHVGVLHTVDGFAIENLNSIDNTLKWSQL